MRMPRLALVAVAVAALAGAASCKGSIGAGSGASAAPASAEATGWPPAPASPAPPRAPGDEGRVLPALSPSALRDTLANPAGPLGTLQRLRDADLDRLNSVFKEYGTAQGT